MARFARNGRRDKMRDEDEMKYVLLIGDGMADIPDGKTPLQVADTPNMDFIASSGNMGVARTIPSGCEAGSDIAILSILGYDPLRYYTGRGPLEAMGMGIPLSENDTVFRCNLVTVDGDVMIDYSSGHISSEEAEELINALNRALKPRLNEILRRKGADIEFYPGVSYRNVLVIRGCRIECSIPPPHDVLGETITLPDDEMLREIVLASRDVLESHEINEKRAREKRANMIWLWGGGVVPNMPPFKRYGVGGGCVISAVMLVKGIGRCIGLDVIEVPGATGFIDTNYEGKVSHALECLLKHDFVLVHVEAPDEASHIGDFDLKVKAIEEFDRRIVGKMLNGLSSLFNEYRILLMPDHATPVSLKTHTSDPVPFAIYDSKKAKKGSAKKRCFDEKSALLGEIGMIDAKILMKKLLNSG